uniref:Uncharacterized protein n=1 Tax=Vespula pensylvanica TaxID=30213 RepID=A0A834PA32_VESPE|nr:hypothetical protein H0235_002409 [Vespula pensylvanica]
MLIALVIDTLVRIPYSDNPFSDSTLALHLTTRHDTIQQQHDTTRHDTIRYDRTGQNRTKHDTSSTFEFTIVLQVSSTSFSNDVDANKNLDGTSFLMDSM